MLFSLVLTNPNFYRRKITYLTPTAGDLPSKYLIMGTLTWLEFNMNLNSLFFYHTHGVMYCSPTLATERGENCASVVLQIIHMKHLWANFAFLCYYS